MVRQSAVILSALLSLSMLLVAASSFVLEANAQTVKVETSVHLVADRYQGYVGQFFRVNITVEPPPPTLADYFHDIIVNITKPDGTIEILNLMTNKAVSQTVYGPNNSVQFEYVFDQTGIFTVSAKYTGDNYIKVGANTWVGANLMVTKDLPADSIAMLKQQEDIQPRKRS